MVRETSMSIGIHRKFHRGRTILTVVAALSLLMFLDACKRPHAGGGEEVVVELVRAGRHDEALARLDEHGDDEKAVRLRVAILSFQGRTPEAVEALVDGRSPDAGTDALLMEGIWLSSYPPSMRPDPLAVARVEQADTPFGTFTTRAVRQALEHERDTLVPESRLMDLVRLLGPRHVDTHVQTLRQLVEQKKRPAIRYGALEALVATSTPAAARAMAEVAREFAVSQLMQRHVLDALARDPQMGVELAVELLDSPHGPVRARAAGILRDAAGKQATGLLAQSSRIEATAALAGRGEGTGTQLASLQAHLESLETPLERSRFIGLMRETAGPAMVPIICQEALAPEPGVATTALSLLSSMGEVSGAPCIVEAAGSENQTVARAALRALLDVPAKGQEDALMGILEEALEKEDETTACLAIGALGNTGSSDASEVLDDLLESDTDRIRVSAAVALYHMGRDDVLPTVEEAFEDDTGPWAIYSYFEWRLLATSPDERTIPLLGRAVEEGNPSLRDKVLEGLADSGHPESIFLTERYVLSRIANPSLEFRNPAAGKVAHIAKTVLEKIGRGGDGKPRRKLLARMLGSTDTYLVAVALRQLEIRDGSWARKQARAVMEEAKDPWLVLEAVRCLALLAASKRPEG